MKYVLQADGASRGNPGQASYGCVVLSINGEVVAELAETLGVRTNNFAEYHGAIAGLTWLVENDPSGGFILQMDSKLVVEQLSGRWKIKHQDLIPLAIQARALLSQLNGGLEWIPRERNSLADALANAVLDGQFTGSSAPAPALPTLPPVLAVSQPRSTRAPRQFVEPTTLVVVRHGHTLDTENGLISGSDGTDPVLSELGQYEATQTASAIRRLLTQHNLAEPSKIVHSPMLRTTQTALPIAEEFGLPLAADARLREIGFGAWEGLGMDAIAQLHPTEVASWRGSMTAKPAGGESVSDLEFRVQDVVQELVAGAAGSTVVLVTHMMPLRAIARLATQGAADNSWSIQFSPASVSIFRFFGGSLTEIFTLNSLEHLYRD